MPEKKQRDDPTKCAVALFYIWSDSIGEIGFDKATKLDADLHLVKAV